MTGIQHPFRLRLAKSRRLVVKVGSGVLTGADQRLNRVRVASLVKGLSSLVESGIQTILVTSGAVATGAPVMGLAGRTKTIPQKQACAAIGQTLLMALYEECFSTRGHHSAQILLTQDDVRSRERYLNARNTFETLISAGVVPIVNENDSVAVSEIKFGDNDNLSAEVAALVGADLLLILSTTDGLYEKFEPGQQPIPLVEQITNSHFDYAKDHLSPTGISTGGMKSKLMSIKKANQYGIAAVLAGGQKDDIIQNVISGKNEGTLFLPCEDKLSAREYWILHTLSPKGTLSIDAGARRALTEHGRSLLPIGITGVEGNFRSGNSVRIAGPDGIEIARGLTYYSSQEVVTIKGCKTDEIESKLGYRYYDEVVHRDNLVLII
ncbi:MAG: glutamate 5-kinase [Acidobacteria bacterium]|nr:MAG: glutamate 5-kinase [Acidobacteriota bacterium]